MSNTARLLCDDFITQESCVSIDDSVTNYDIAELFIPEKDLNFNTKKNATLEFKKPEKKGSQSKHESVKNSSLSLDASFYCVISEIDLDKKELIAQVYDQKEKVQVMEIDLPFDNFEKNDIPLIKVNSIFYWRIGKKSNVVKSKHNKQSVIVENFSSFKMRRTYVSKVSIETRLSSRLEKFKRAFA